MSLVYKKARVRIQEDAPSRRSQMATCCCIGCCHCVATLVDGHEFYMFLIGLVASELGSRRNDLFVSSTTRSLRALTGDMFASHRRPPAIDEQCSMSCQARVIRLGQILYPPHPSEGEAYKNLRSSASFVAGLVKILMDLAAGCQGWQHVCRRRQVSYLPDVGSLSNPP